MLSFELPRYSDGKINRNKITDEMFNEICSLTPWVEDTTRNSITERLYCIEHSITECPKCEICSENDNFWTGQKYSTTCSKECKKIIVKNKVKETNLKKFGFEYASQSQEAKDKYKQTCLKHYGVEYPLQSKEIQEKYKQTCLERYGVENPLQTKEVREKALISLLNYFQERRKAKE
jgi:hypothetical protein